MISRSLFFPPLRSFTNNVNRVPGDDFNCKWKGTTNKYSDDSPSEMSYRQTVSAAGETSRRFNHTLQQYPILSGKITTASLPVNL
jgi:hypothetical protein